MSLNKKQMVREIGRRTHLRNREAQEVIEALVALWTEELVRGGQIELENFMVLETQTVHRNPQRRMFTSGDSPQVMRRVSLKVSRQLKARLNQR